MFNNILKMKLREIKKTAKREFRSVSNEIQLCTAWVQVMSADIPMKMMFEITPSVNLNVYHVYRGDIRQLETVWTA